MESTDTNRIIEMLELVGGRQDRLEKTLLTIQREQQSPWMDIQGTANYLNISVRTIRRLVSAGTIPFVRRDTESGKAKLFFHRKQLDLWMFTGSTNPNKKQRDLYKSLV